MGPFQLTHSYRMCVLKHSKLLSLTVRKECFNTLEFLVSQKRFHPRGRPFVLVYSVTQDRVPCQPLCNTKHHRRRCVLAFLPLGALLRHA